VAPRVIRRTCIICPRGCSLEITIDHGHIAVDGHECPKGEDYGVLEVTAPRRILTTTVRTTVPTMPRLPVRSVGEVLRMEMERLMREIDSIVVAPPVRCGDLVATNLCGISVDLIATDDLAPPGPDAEERNSVKVP